MLSVRTQFVVMIFLFVLDSNAVPLSNNPAPVLTQRRTVTFNQAEPNRNAPAAQNDNPVNKGSGPSDSSPQGFLGPNVNVGPYDNDFFNFRSGGPVQFPDELSTDFGSSNCWDNAKSYEIKWEKATGAPDAKKTQLNFGTTTGPDQDFLIAYSKTKRKPTDSAKFESCSIGCATGDVKLSLKYWTSSGVILNVCTREVFFDDEEPGNCQKLPTQKEPGPTTITLKNLKKLSAIVIKADNFIDPKGGIAIIDDIQVTVTLCQNNAPTESPAKGLASQPPSSQVDSAATCQNVVCSLQHNLCSYKDMSESGRATKKFSIQQGRYHNAVTGIEKGALPSRPSASFGKKYAAAYLLRNDVAGLESGDLTFLDDRILEFQYYVATQNIHTKVCFDKETTCPFNVGGNVDIADRAWKPLAVRVPKATKKILIISHNTGVNEGAVGVTDIKLLLPNKNGTDGTISACPYVPENTVLQDQRNVQSQPGQQPVQSQSIRGLPERTRH